MSVNLSVKDVPDELAQALRERAARNHRSLQGELMAILTQTIQAEGALATAVTPSGIRESAPTQAFTRSWVQGWKTVEDVHREVSNSAWARDPALKDLPRAVDLIRSDRDSR
jgi:plasmid stability protein